MEDLDPDFELFGDRAPVCRAEEAVILVVNAWIDPISPASVDRPGSKVLLQPQWQEQLGVPRAEFELLISGRYFYQREYGDLWVPVILTRCDKAIFHTELDVPQREPGVAIDWCGVVLRHDGTELQIGQRAVVELDTR